MMQIKNSISEHSEQKTLVDWWDLWSRTKGLNPLMLFAIPNGEKRTIQAGIRLKDEGVRPGVPDLFLAHPSKCWHGLFIEMKKKKGGIVSEAQKYIHKILTEQGYCVCVCKGFEHAKFVIQGYIGDNDEN